MCSLVGNELPLTQEFLAQMMGVTRSSVTGVATQLQNEGLISHRRAKITLEHAVGRTARMRMSSRGSSQKLLLLAPLL
jgi:Mn-dependent DtxR family transcriptional regulator